MPLLLIPKVLLYTVADTVALLVGPEIRTGLLEGGGSAIVNLVKGRQITLSLLDADKEKGTAERIWVDYKNLPKELIFIIHLKQLLV